MAITSLADLLSAVRETKIYTSPVMGVSSNTAWHMFHQVLANATSGIVPTAGSGGTPVWSWSAGNGYLSRLILASNGQGGGNFMLFDRLFSVGPFNALGTVTLSGQPSYASRLPGGSYDGLQLWFENMSVPGGTSGITVNYTNENGVSGQVSGTTSITINTGNAGRLALAAGDLGVQMIESVTLSLLGINANIHVYVVRPLAVVTLYHGDEKAMFWDLTGLPEVYPTSCITGAFNPYIASSNYVLGWDIEVASK